MSIAFVAGATGYTGREVVAALVERGVRAVAHVRPDSPRLEAWRDRLGGLGAEVDITPWTPADMQARLGALVPSHVFALLGTTRKRGRMAAREGREESYESVDYGLAKLLMDAAVATGAGPRFVYLSSAGVSARASGAYMQARWRAEEALRGCGLPYLIARPSFITGSDRDEDRPGERVGAAVSDGLLAVAGLLGARRLRARYRSTSNQVLARALVARALDATTEAVVLESEDLRLG
ncbi:NAD(P)H-binding protein [Haliangium sp.]|uniref:NAD(P)H-binding protein n=1 Tax=Haliangium sp. TaxID=2663208 RepID=UPI003D128703